MVKAPWNHVGIRWSTFCGKMMKHHAMRILTLTVFTLCAKVCWVHQIVETSNRTGHRAKFRCFQQVAGQGFQCCSCETRNRSFAKVKPNIRIQFKHPVCSTITRALLFLQMEEFVFGARRHDPAIDVGVLMDVRAACMMRRMPPKTSDEGRLIQKT